MNTADAGRLAFDSLHQRYARMEADYAVSIRGLPEDRELFRWPTDASAPAREFLFSPDGRFLAWLDQHGKLGIWRCESGKSVLNSPPKKSTTLAFSPDSRRLAVAQKDSITFFDLATGEVSHRWRAQDQIHALSFHPNSLQVAVGYSLANTVAVYRLDGGLVASLPTGTDTRTALAWHPDGELLAFGGFDARIQIWNVKTRRKVAALEGHANQVNFLMFHWSGEILASTSWDGTMRLWQPTPGRLLMQLPARAMGFSREDRWAGTILSSIHEAQLWSIVSSQEYRTFLNTFSVDEITLREGDISPDGALLALAASDGVRLWDMEHGREVAWLHLGDTTCLLFREEGRELLTCGPKDGLRRWPVEAGATSENARRIGPSRQIALPFEPWRVAKSRDDHTLAIAGETAGQCLVLDLSAESHRTPPLSHPNAGFIALSPDAQHAASSGWHSDLVKIWDRRTGRLIKKLETNSSSVVFFTPDSRELIVAREKEFTFHDLHSFQISRRMARAPGLFPGHVAFTRDGSMMAMELTPGVIDLKEFTTGRTVARLEDPNGDRSSWMCFSPDGTQLLVAARYAGAIHRWDLRAVRERLKPMNLDWDWPEFPPLSPVDSSLSKSRPSLRVQVIAPQPDVSAPLPASNGLPVKP
jgi:WD40 repeat protein